MVGVRMEPLGTKWGRICLRICTLLRLMGSFDDGVDQREFLLVGEIQTVDMAENSCSVSGRHALGQFALPVGRRGGMHDHANALLSFD